MIKTLFVDMDGVFVDYEKHFNELSPTKLSVYNGVPELESELDEIKKVFISQKEFFLNAPIMEDGYELYEGLIILQKEYKFNISLLTAVGQHHSDIAIKQKMAWAKKHIPIIPFNYVIRSHHKANFAEMNTLLVDDRQKALKPFLEKGGKGILHTSANETISELKHKHLFKMGVL